jgi:dGTPase
VAYINHDIEDAIRAGVITAADLPATAVRTLGKTHAQRVNTMVSDIIASSWEVRAGDIIKKRPAIRMSPDIIGAAEALNDFLFKRVYNVRAARRETVKAREVVRFLYRYYLEHEDKLPPEYRQRNDTIARRVADYIAGMTDQYALRTAATLRRAQGKRKKKATYGEHV